MCGSVASSDSLRSIAGATRRPRTLSTTFPNSRSRMPPRSTTGIRVDGPAYTPARDGGFMREHVAQHFRANRPRPSPAVSAKLLDAAPTIAERFGQHLRAASGALGQSRSGLLRRATRAVELRRNLQVRRGEPDPLGADVVHVREDRRNGAGLAGRLGSPGVRVEMLDDHLVHAIVGDKDPDRGAAELSVGLVLTRGHGSPLWTIFSYRGRTSYTERTCPNERCCWLHWFCALRARSLPKGDKP